jgi:hypothetical protein
VKGVLRCFRAPKLLLASLDLFMFLSLTVNTVFVGQSDLMTFRVGMRWGKKLPSYCTIGYIPH